MWVNSIELDKSFHHEVVDKQEQTGQKPRCDVDIMNMYVVKCTLHT